MSKYLAAVILALSLALAGSGYLLKRSYAANGAQKTKIEQLVEAQRVADAQAVKDRALITKRSRENAAAAAAFAKQRSALEAALARNAVWADQSIPQEVQDALQP